MKQNYTTGEEIRAVAEQIKARADSAGGLKRIFCVACGGSLGGLYPLEYLLRCESKELNVYSISSNEFVYATPAGVDENALVVTCSMTGTTPETVEAALRARERGAIVVTMSASADTPLAEQGQFHLVYANSHELHGGYDATNMALALRLGFELLRVCDGYAHYEEAMAGFEVLDASIGKALARCKRRADQFGREHKDDKVIYLSLIHISSRAGQARSASPPSSTPPPSPTACTTRP